MAGPDTSAKFPLLVSREHAGNRIGDALRVFVGRGRRYSVKQLSNGTGVKERLIECALCDPASLDYRPLPPECVLSLMLFLGEDFASEVIAPAKMGAYALPEPGDVPPGVIAADNSEDNAALTRMASSGVFDSHERPALRVIGTNLVSRGMQLRSLAA